MKPLPAMYIFLNKGLHMSTGKCASQAAHAAVLATLGSTNKKLVDQWLHEGQHYMKLVMQAESDQNLYNIQKYIEARGFKTFMIIDEGLTEITPFSVTALGVEVVDKNDPHVAATFSCFSLYKDTVRVTLELEK